MDKNLKMGPWADKKIEKRDLERTKGSKNGTLGGQGKNCSQKVRGSALVVCRIVEEDGKKERRKEEEEGAEDFQRTKNERKLFASLA